MARLRPVDDAQRHQQLLRAQVLHRVRRRVAVVGGRRHEVGHAAAVVGAAAADELERRRVRGRDSVGQEAVALEEAADADVAARVLAAQPEALRVSAGPRPREGSRSVGDEAFLGRAVGVDALDAKGHGRAVAAVLGRVAASLRRRIGNGGPFATEVAQVLARGVERRRRRRRKRQRQRLGLRARLWRTLQAPEAEADDVSARVELQGQLLGKRRALQLARPHGRDDPARALAVGARADSVEAAVQDERLESLAVGAVQHDLALDLGHLRFGGPSGEFDAPARGVLAAKRVLQRHAPRHRRRRGRARHKHAEQPRGDHRGGAEARKK
mmetsp:Transcript_21826/g.73983  ORF Transcript_21826/g.73983 Transcript_21826/m.73983 type:complete len:327 (-) Transcript_21826:13-993(-)